MPPPRRVRSRSGAGSQTPTFGGGFQTPTFRGGVSRHPPSGFSRHPPSRGAGPQTPGFPGAGLGKRDHRHPPCRRKPNHRHPPSEDRITDTLPSEKPDHRHVAEQLGSQTRRQASRIIDAHLFLGESNPLYRNTPAYPVGRSGRPTFHNVSGGGRQPLSDGVGRWRYPPPGGSDMHKDGPRWLDGEKKHRRSA